MAALRYNRADPRDIPNYSAAEAARWLGLVPQTLRIWLVGQTYTTRQGTKRALPAIRPAGRDPLELSFWNVVECSVLAAIRRVHGVSFQKVRRALTFVEKQLGKRRPLIQQEFATDGVDLFIERYENLVSASESGQLAIRDLLEASLTRIDRDPTGLASRLYPWTHLPNEPRAVAMDVRVSFGRPVLVNTSVPVDVILQRFRAGDTIHALAADYRVNPSDVENLLRWAAGGTAAA